MQVELPQIDTQPVQQVVEALPPLAVMVLGGLVVIGFVLWLLGRSLARPACAVSGLVLGGLVGFVLGQRFAEQGAFTLPLVLGGGIAGGLLAALLFRVWMAISCAALLALVVPAASIVWQGTAPPLELTLGEAGEAETAPEAPLRGEDAEAADAALPGPVQALWERTKEAYGHHAGVVRTWWDELGSGARWALTFGGLIGAGAGLLLGLIAPYWAASLQTALVGGLLMFYPGREVLMRLAPDHTGWLPNTPRLVILSLGLITLLGVLVQWTLFVRRADK